MATTTPTLSSDNVIDNPALSAQDAAASRRRSSTKRLGDIGFWLVLAIAFIFFIFPLFWIVVTSIKGRADVTPLPPRFVPFLDFQPTIDNYKAVFAQGLDPTGFMVRQLNSVLIAGSATVLAVMLGTLAAYSFSRFRIKGESDMLFFILSTRMLPPIVVLIPIFLMFVQPFGFAASWAASATDPGMKEFFTNLSQFNLRESYLGITVLYTTVGLPFVVWMMKGFFDEIPKEYEEAAMLDGYSRIEAIWRFVLPEALPAMLATAVFVLITAWNEFVFVQILNPSRATTVPPFLYAISGVGTIEWGRIAAGGVVFLVPVVVFTFLVRNHLLRGVTFGAVRR
ncbi:MAG: carbohydrate ABC transporter permease [Chloroflexota bacterium]|nr:carbohydrate ABC transporter permease [Chloroflexota bacterium]